MMMEETSNIRLAKKLVEETSLVMTNHLDLQLAIEFATRVAIKMADYKDRVYQDNTWFLINEC